MRVATLPRPSFHAAVNHLLHREPWARAQLMPYRGRRARLHFAPFALAVRVDEDGLLAGLGNTGAINDNDAGNDVAVDVTITVMPDAVPALLRYGPSVLMKHVRIEGDAEFAQALGRLAENLRWEPEEDLAQWLGDAAANRLMRGARDVATQVQRTAGSLFGQLAEYFFDERPQWVRRRVNDQWAQQVAATAADVATLEARIARLERLARPLAPVAQISDHSASRKGLAR